MLEKTGTTPITYMAFKIDTGVGKTRLTIQAIVETTPRPGNGRAWVYAVPTLRLGDDIVKLFAALGFSARVFRGRGAFVPNDPTKQKMCLNLKQVDLAIKAGETVSEACCRSERTDRQCLYHNQCAYQAQFTGQTPDIWVCAHELLFHEMPAFGDPIGVVIDESFWQSGLRGIGPWRWCLRLDDMRGCWTQEGDTADPDSMHGTSMGRRGQVEDAAELNALRNKLAAALDAQPENGGVVRAGLAAAITADECSGPLRGFEKCVYSHRKPLSCMDYLLSWS